VTRSATPAAYNAFFVQHAGAAAQLYIDTKRPRHAVRLHVAMANALLSNPPDDVASKDRGVDLFHAVLARLDADGWHDAYLQVALQLAAAQRHAGALHASTQTIATLVALAARSRQLAASPSCINQWQLLVDVARSDKLERNVEAPFAALGVLSATLGDVNAARRVAARLASHAALLDARLRATARHIRRGRWSSLCARPSTTTPRASTTRSTATTRYSRNQQQRTSGSRWWCQ
jgi:hypothetical protein